MIQKLNLFDKNTTIITFRLLLSVTIVLAITLNFNLYKPMWGIIAALFLQLRPETGFVIEKALCLIAGTFIGILVGCLIVFVFIGQPIPSFICLMIFLCICSLISAGINHSNFVYGITLGNITAIIVVLYCISDPQNITIINALNFASARLIEISIGSIAACISSFLIMPHSIKSIYKTHSQQLLKVTIKYLITLTDKKPNSFCINLATREILESAIAIHNDSSASIYENLPTKNNHILFANKALAFLKLIKDYCRYSKFNNDLIFQEYSATLNSCLKEILEGNTRDILHKIKNNVYLPNQPKAITNIYLALIKLLLIYNSIDTEKSSIRQLKPNKIKNCYNPAIVATATIRNIAIFLVCAVLWVLSGYGIGLLLATAIMTLLSQLFVGIPNAFSFVKKILIGLVVSAPIALIIKFGFIYQYVENLEHILLFFSMAISVGVIFLSIKKHQMYGLGYCLGTIFIIQPSNEMSFSVFPAISICLGLLFGGIVFYFIYKLLPNSPNIITQKLALSSIYRDFKNIGKTIHSREQFATTVVKKVLCIYKYEISGNNQSQHIITQLHKLLEISNKKLN